MSAQRKIALAAPVLALLCGCAHYEPAPIAPERSVAAWDARSLADAGLRDFIAANLDRLPESWPPEEWNLDLLTLAAFYYHPDLDVARASTRVLDAGVMTAAARPNLGFSFDTSYVTPGVISRWILTPAFTITRETRGKRGLRVRQAELRADSGRLELAATAWEVRSRLRASLAESLLAAREAEVLAAEERIRSELVALLDRAVALGDLPRQLASAARIELNTVRQRRLEADGAAEQARAALAASVGVPVAALESVAVVFPPPEALPDETIVLESAPRDALLNRLDVRRALIDYDVSEVALQLEIAEQYPDLQFGPGYRWREDEQRWQLGFALELPPDRNRGPIAEALAGRELAAARFHSVQAAALGELERALAAYRAAQRSFDVATESVRAVEARQRDTERAFELGDANAIALGEARLETAVAEREQLIALRNLETALAALEDAVQAPLDASSRPPPVSETQPRAGG